MEKSAEWAEMIALLERLARGGGDPLRAALRATVEAAQVGFDWPSAEGPLEKLDEELAELRAVLQAPGAAGAAARAHELGDLLLSVVNLARHLGVEPEAALAAAVRRFEARFGHVRDALGGDPGAHSLAEMDARWEEAKAREGAGGGGEPGAGR